MMMYSIEQFYKLKDNDINLSDLNDYLFNIISEIETELKSSIKKNYDNNTSNDNWRKRKNPNFMSSFVDKDKNILDINYALNKITETNYELIIEDIKKILDNLDKSDEVEYVNKLTEYLSYITNNLFEKAIIQPIFIKYYVLFLKNLTKYYDNSIIINDLSDLNNSFIEFIQSDEECLNTTINEKIKDVNQYKNLGVFFANYTNIFEIKSNYNLISNYLVKILTFLDWEPVNKDNLEININLFSSYLEELSQTLSNNIEHDEEEHIYKRIEILTQNKLVPIKVRFQIQDLLDTLTSNKINNSDVNNNNKNVEKNDNLDDIKKYSDSNNQNNNLKFERKTSESKGEIFFVNKRKKDKFKNNFNNHRHNMRNNSDRNSDGNYNYKNNNRRKHKSEFFNNKYDNENENKGKFKNNKNKNEDEKRNNYNYYSNLNFDRKI